MTNMIGLDTTAIIDLFKKDTSLQKRLEDLKNTFVTTTINYWEIKGGLNPKDNKYTQENEYYENFFKDLAVFDFDKNAVKNSSEVFWDLANSGQMIDDFDCMVAGTLLANGVTTIITRNKKHFERIKGLKVLSY
ncbi:MAG: type II toxin-antitoxin system VapC family toxin [Nanoarchaeota archaeon]